VLAAEAVFDALRGRGATFFTGVPDSLLRELCSCIEERASSTGHVIAANEGAAVALAAGHHLGSGGLPVVYLQNSGLGNAINPLLSLADAEVYALPMILIVGWRGEPAGRDEPQHVKQGRVMLAMLEAMELPYRVLSPDVEAANADIAWAAHTARAESRPVALVVRKGTFAPYTTRDSARRHTGVGVTRERAIALVVDALDPHDVVVSTTGMISRELFETRVRRGEGTRDFLTVGSMGHASAIAAAIALARPERQVFCLDGDGAYVMHMGSVAVQGQLATPNFKHVILNNGCHDSVGGQPTVGLACDLTAVARSCGYTTVDHVADEHGLTEAVRLLRSIAGPALLEIHVLPGSRPDVRRPSASPRENKEAFLRFLSSGAS